jgi:hypothetical protein
MIMVLANSVLTAIDCDDPVLLANFYAQIIGGKIHEFEFGASGESGWVEIRDGEVRLLALQKVPDYQPPTWPSGGLPQQMHLDFQVEHLDAGEEFVLSIGAVKCQVQPGETFRVFLDPAGHPFCLVVAGALPE